MQVYIGFKFEIQVNKPSKLKKGPIMENKIKLQKGCKDTETQIRPDERFEVFFAVCFCHFKATGSSFCLGECCQLQKHFVDKETSPDFPSVLRMSRKQHLTHDKHNIYFMYVGYFHPHLVAAVVLLSSWFN